MALIKWRDSYSTGIEEIDDEHKFLVKLINNIFIAVRDKNEQASGLTLDELITYTQVHFDHEEKLMAKANYPNLEEHKIIHKKLLEKVNEYKYLLENSDAKILQELYIFLREWLMDHIMKEDMAFKVYHDQL